MGWLFTHESKQDLIKNRLADPARYINGAKLIASRTVGNNHWYVVERADGTRFIGLDRLQKSEDGYGYKDMDESMGPYYYDCPVSFLKMAPLGDHSGIHAKAWREKVLEKAANKRTYKENMVVKFGDHFYTLLQKIGYSWEAVDNNGKHWKLTPSVLKASEII